jgi:hypothetical protein
MADRLTNWVKGQFSLDTPEQDFLSPETGGDFAASLVPGVGTAMGVRDVARAVKAQDPVAGAAAVAGLLPFGRLLKSPITKLLRSGGRKDLQIAHVLENPEDLLSWDKSKVRELSELSSPSFSITPKGEEVPFFTPTSPIIVPKPNALEPFNHPSEIGNRDLWSKRGAGMSWGLRSPEKRLAQRMDPESLRLKEDEIGLPGSTGEYSHDMTIMQSPSFKSFKHYENDPAGAALLHRQDLPGWVHPYEEKMHGWLDKQGFQYKDQGEGIEGTIENFSNMQRMLREGAASGDKEARSILREARLSPSEYAEVKTKGPLSLTPEKIAGIMFPNDPNHTPETKKLIDLLRNRYEKKGLPTHSYDTTTWPDLARDIEKVQQQAPHYGRR